MCIRVWHPTRVPQDWFDKGILPPLLDSSGDQVIDDDGVPLLLFDVGDVVFLSHTPVNIGLPIDPWLVGYPVKVFDGSIARIEMRYCNCTSGGTSVFQRGFPTFRPITRIEDEFGEPILDEETGKEQFEGGEFVFRQLFPTQDCGPVVRLPRFIEFDLPHTFPTPLSTIRLGRLIRLATSGIQNGCNVVSGADRRSDMQIPISDCSWHEPSRSGVVTWRLSGYGFPKIVINFKQVDVEDVEQGLEITRLAIFLGFGRWQLSGGCSINLQANLAIGFHFPNYFQQLEEPLIIPWDATTQRFEVTSIFPYNELLQRRAGDLFGLGPIVVSQGSGPATVYDDTNIEEIITGPEPFGAMYFWNPAQLTCGGPCWQSTQNDRRVYLRQY
jgi:hypothetical protein